MSVSSSSRSVALVNTAFSGASVHSRDCDRGVAAEAAGSATPAASSVPHTHWNNSFREIRMGRFLMQAVELTTSVVIRTVAN